MATDAPTWELWAAKVAMPAMKDALAALEGAQQRIIELTAERDDFYRAYRIDFDRISKAAIKRAEAADARLAVAGQALREVVTNGEWRGGTDWCISTAVYEMAADAVATVLGEGPQP